MAWKRLCKASVVLVLIFQGIASWAQDAALSGTPPPALDVAATIAKGLVGSHEERVQSIGTMIECSAYFARLSSRGFAENEAESLILMSRELSIVASALWGSYTPSGIQEVKRREAEALGEWDERFQQGFERSSDNVEMFHICDQAFIAAAAFRQESRSSP